jgi:hypothetical protein
MSHSINSVAAVHTGGQVQGIHTHVAAVGHTHPAIPGREAAEDAVGIDPAVGSPAGNRTKPVGHQGADHTEAELGHGVAEVGHTLLRTGLLVVGGHHDVHFLAHPWCRKKNR